MEETRQLALAVGQTHSERLPGLAAAGYTWSWSAEGDTQALGVSLRRAIEATPQAPGGPPPGTVSFDEGLELHALAPGSVVLRLVLKRPWGSSPPREVRTFHVRISPARSPQP